MIHHFFELLWSDILHATWLEIVAASLGVISTWYAKKASILLYPTGIISVLIYVFICFKAQLYANMGINAYYFVFSVYGWILWSKKDENGEEELPVTYSDKKTWILSILIFLVSVGVIQVLLRVFKSGNVTYWSTVEPYLDTLTTAVAIVAMWLTAVKKVENWIFWTVTNLVSIPLFLYKGLAFTGLQFFIFLIISVFGYIEWRKLANEEIQKQKAKAYA